LLRDAQAGRFAVILAESLDRLSRDQEDIAHIFKRISFAGGRIVTLSEGDINELHIGLKGTMGALYLKDLADKTRRGLRGRVEAGKSGGGNSYGYDVVHGLGPNGEPLTGERRINARESAIVRRIFEEYAAGVSPRAIAKRLNAEGVSGPFGKTWGPSTIHGNRQRGTGILNNELYIGRLVWNRPSGRRFHRAAPLLLSPSRGCRQDGRRG
jgi:DNA invertase Pin-like site-specific DNA recombinase